MCPMSLLVLVQKLIARACFNWTGWLLLNKRRLTCWRHLNGQWRAGSGIWIGGVRDLMRIIVLS